MIFYCKNLPRKSDICSFVSAFSCTDVIKWAEKKVSSFYEELKNYHIIVDSIIIDTMTEDDLLLIDPEDVLEI